MEIFDKFFFRRDSVRVVSIMGGWFDGGVSGLHSRDKGENP